jgi:hypothetical protein
VAAFIIIPANVSEQVAAQSLSLLRLLLQHFQKMAASSSGKYF